jgi:hypothetical protein
MVVSSLLVSQEQERQQDQQRHYSGAETIDKAAQAPLTDPGTCTTPQEVA